MNISEKYGITPGAWNDNWAELPEEWYADELIAADGKVLAATITSPKGYGLATAQANKRAIVEVPVLIAMADYIAEDLNIECSCTLKQRDSGHLVGCVAQERIELRNEARAILARIKGAS